MKLFLDTLAQYDIPAVATAAGLNPSTLYHWLSGHTKEPRLSSIAKVAPLIGLEISIVAKRHTVRRVA